MSCGVVHRCSSDPMLLWHRPTAVAPIGLLAWEQQNTVGEDKKKKRKKKKKKKRGDKNTSEFVTLQAD